MLRGLWDTRTSRGSMVIESDSPLSGYGGEMAGVVGAEVEGLWLSSLYSETFVFSEHCCVLRHFMRSWGSGVLRPVSQAWELVVCIASQLCLQRLRSIARSIDITVIIFGCTSGLPPPHLVVKHLLAHHRGGGGMVYRKQGKQLPPLGPLSGK